MSALQWFVSGSIRVGTDILCEVEGAPLSQVPMHGPLIVVANHIGSLEVPLLHSHLQPRRIIGVAKIETWDNPLMGWLFDLWQAIPVRRGEVNLEAIRRSLAALAAGDILVVAPEGTRSRDGQLQRARPGVVPIALRSGAPILPVAHWGAEQFSANLQHLKRTAFHIRVGRTFHVIDRGAKMTREVRQVMVDEIMYQIAALMPPQYRGEYAALDQAAESYLQFA